MAEKIQLDLILNDAGALTTLKELRDFAAAANEELKITDKNSLRYAELKSAIAAANSELAAQQKQLKGITSEEFASAFARIGAGISSAFAAGTAALNIFGVESENVAKSSAAAQNALTIALASRQTLEGIISLRLLANNAAEKIRLALLKANILATTEQTVATGAETVAEEVNTAAKVKNTGASVSNTAATEGETAATLTNASAKTTAGTATGFFATALRGLYTVMAANPFVALLSLIGAAVAAFILLADETDEAAEAQKRYNLEVEKGKRGTDAQRFQISSLVAVIRDLTQSEEDRLTAYKLLQKALPSLGDLTMEEAIQTGELTKIYERNIKILEKKAELDAKIKASSEAKTKAFEAEQKVQQAKNDLENANVITRTFRENDLKRAEDERSEAIKYSNELNLEASDIQEAYTALLIDDTITTEENTGAKGDNAAASQRQINNNNKLIAILDELGRYLKDEIKLYKEFGKVVTVEDKLPDIVNRANEAFKQRIGLIDDATNAYFRGIKDLGLISESVTEEMFQNMNKVVNRARAEAIGEFGGILQGFEPIYENLIYVSDTFGKTINDNYLNFIQSIGLSTDLFGKNLDTTKDKFLTLFEAGQITPDALKSLNAVSTNLSNLNSLITQGTVNLQALFNPKSAKEYYDATRQILAIEGKITTERDELLGVTKEITIDRQNYRKNEKFIADFEKQIRQQTIDGLNEFLRIEEDGFLERVKQARDSKDITQKQYEAIIALVDQGAKKQVEFQNLIGDIAEQRVESIRNQVRGTEQEFDRIRRYNLQFEQNRLKATKITGAAIVGLIQDETEQFIKFNNIRATKQLTIAQKVKEGQRIINEAGLNNVKFTEEEKIKIYEATFNTQQELKRKAREEDAKEFQRYIQIIQSALNSYSEYITTLNQTANERLAKEEENYLQILEDARRNSLLNEKEYLQKRQELNDEYAALRLASEKKFRLRQLRLDQAQAVVNTALSVSRAFVEGGTAGFITAGLVTAALGLQLAAIQDQINLVQSFKKGGLIKGQQGLIINGPSHENGGVFLQNGGYNLEGGEAVINRTSARNYQGLLSQINQMGGGRPLISSFDDSRIVDAIAKQRMEPIRAYVIEQDITRKQAVSKKLEQLSRF